MTVRIARLTAANVVALAAVLVASCAVLRDWSATSLLAGAVTAVVLVGGFHLHRFASRIVGWWTAGAGLALVGAGALAALALAAPACPGGVLQQRCTAPEVAQWAYLGVLLPASYVILLALPARAAAAVGRALRKLAGRVRATWTARSTGRP